MRKNANVDPTSGANQTAHGTPENARAQISLCAVTYKNLGNPVRTRVLQDGFDRVFAFEHLHMYAVLASFRQSLLERPPFRSGKSRLQHITCQHITMKPRCMSACSGNHAFEVCARREADEKPLACSPRLLNSVRMQIAL